jgi:hypothetical protein
VENLKFDGTKIGLIVRGKQSHEHSPDLMAQHADVILADGSPMGFFGEGEAHSSGASGSGSSAGYGLNMKGAVFDYNMMKHQRPYYVDLDMAKSKYKIVSTILTVTVSKEEAQMFSEYWSTLDRDPAFFNILGYNCSTRASQGFVHAGVVRGGIPGLDTPDNLYRQLFAVGLTRVKTYYGYIGFSPLGTGKGFDVLFEPLGGK